MRATEYRRARLRARGFCTGSVDSVPVPGDVDAGKRAACALCGKRVAVTVRGLYSHHKAPAPHPSVEKGSR
jgi:hypothetical protein